MNTNLEKTDHPADPATTECAGRKSGLTHLDASGAVHMVDVGAKPVTTRTARAEAVVAMQPATLTRLLADDLPKGDAQAAIRLAGIMAAKRTADLIPLCHPLPLDHVSVTLTPEKPDRLRIETLVQTTGRTGVEMEALTAAAAAALTAYDMCKAIDRGMEIRTVRLLEKSGGRSGHWLRQPEQPDQGNM
jgi:cyclic pyranopterin phosphate synthase